MEGAVTGRISGADAFARAEADGDSGADDVDDALFDWGQADSIGDYAEHTVGEARVIDVRAAPLLLREKTGPAGHRPPLAILHAVVDGHPVYHDGQGGQIALRPGSLVIRRSDETAAIHSQWFARVVTIALAQHLLTPRFVTAAALDHCAVRTDDALPQRLLHSFVAGLAEAKGAAWLTPNVAIVDGIGGLVSMIAAQAPQPRIELSELAVARANEILGHLRRNFANPRLTPTTTAEDLHISVRYAHKLMQLTGRSFRQELVALRLDAARQAFAANRRPRQTIADIAISVGFADLSQFNRQFRAAFAMMPRTARKLDEANGYEAGIRDLG